MNQLDFCCQLPAGAPEEKRVVSAQQHVPEEFLIFFLAELFHGRVGIVRGRGGVPVDKGNDRCPL